MNSNITILDRVLRYISGVGMLTWAIAGGPTWTYGGLYFLVTGSFGFCAIYWVLRINSKA